MTLVLVGAMALSASAQQPVTPQGPGLLGNYYDLSETTPPTFPPGSVPGSPKTPTEPTAKYIVSRIDPQVNFPNITAGPPAWPAPGVNTDGANFMDSWDGFLTVPTTGNYVFTLTLDDGGRAWINQLSPTPDIPAAGANSWVDQGPSPYNSANIALTAGAIVPIRVEHYNHCCGAQCILSWTPPGGAKAVIPQANLSSPAPSDAPVLSASSVAGVAQINLSWVPAGTGTPATAYMVFRATASGAEGLVPIATVSGTTYNDTTVVVGTTYYYIVQPTAYAGCLIGKPSNEVTCAPNPIAVNPNSLMVVELAGTGTITLTTTVAIPATTTITFPLSVTNLTSAGPSFTVPASVSLMGNNTVGQSVTFTVTGVDDQIANDPQTADINIGPTTVNAGGNAAYNGLTFPPVTCTQTESDVAGVLITPSSGLSITNGGPPITFTVQLTSKPNTAASPAVTLNLAASIPYLANVTGPGGLSTVSFTAANWNTPQTITVTPQNVDTQTTYVSSFYVTFTPVQSPDPSYNGIGVNSAFIFEPTSTPPLKHVWSHCGLLGGEGLIPMGLLMIIRRWRRKASKQNPGR